MTSIEILQKYWKHDAFREPQEAIINSVVSGQDTLAILPTGGGKSICFQIPALLQDGLCLVISPLIALMKNQVENLQKIGLNAIALTGGISENDTLILLDNCRFGNYKFLYISPEKLQIDWLFDNIKTLNINTIAIDEAHCVSQWGHDFRPAYLKIAKLKTFFPKIPFIALTASATSRVKSDILVQLGIEKAMIFQKSFARPTLAYMTFEIEDKLFRIQQILNKNKESSIIYVRNRKSCHDYLNKLTQMGFTACIYHGGLHPSEKQKNMSLWMTDKVQVMIATNAFGMGIDKPNVRTVIHVQIPDNLENYYQEVGRAGRDGQKAYGILLFHHADFIQSKAQVIDILPDKIFLTEVYIKLCNHLQIPYSEGFNESYSFNLNQFCTKYQFPITKTYQAIQFLDRQGIITLSHEYSEKTAIHFIISSKEVIRYRSLNPKEDALIVQILRNYPGVYEGLTYINTHYLAQKLQIEEAKLKLILTKLHQKGVIALAHKNNDAQLIMNEIREDKLTINKISKHLATQNQLKIAQFEAVLQFITNKTDCKNKLILNYFGENTETNCGICSNCISKQQKATPNQNSINKIIKLLQVQEMDSRELEIYSKLNSNDLINGLKVLLDCNQISLLKNNKYSIK